MPNYYPVMLDLRGRPATVVGGDAAAAEKAAGLAAAGAAVTVQSHAFCDDLEAMAARGEVTLRRKAYASGDLAGAFIVVAAVTYDQPLVEAVWAETQARGQLTNIVDVPARCNFIVPSILRRDQLTIAVSTEGAAPGLAKRIRQRLEGLFPPAYGAYLRLGAVARAHLRGHGVSYNRRDQFFGDYVASGALARLAEDDTAGAAAVTSALLSRYDVETLAEELLACRQTCEGACGAAGGCRRARERTSVAGDPA
jgi:precorrin-2 dehydrogenase/sirohydrochlorin ferrochelatase